MAADRFMLVRRWIFTDRGFQRVDNVKISFIDTRVC